MCNISKSKNSIKVCDIYIFYQKYMFKIYDIYDHIYFVNLSIHEQIFFARVKNILIYIL